ncbi:transmembrane protein 170A-like isoform X1 [Amphibalanus amphitrite]|nr:transmembrane protein 170A-like isoform X1 [Amphibalanus amphitrite]XP_043245956.1 transmembrane protein 170A-like isoform X1 [Amphibalanus amphitrite]XP_043245957.1 transmembrane protein 170A-like isoform X1 [Amphibalanus amphitrite]
MSTDFLSSELDTLSDVIGLTPSDPLDMFAEMWYQVFLWALFSSMFIHIIAAAIAFFTLRKHKIGKLVPPLMLVVGVAGPLTAGVITSATIAFVYRASAFTMPPFYALLWGCGQTVAGLCLSFSRILATL